MSDKSRHSVGATGEADDEKVGRPESFRIGGYFKDKNSVGNTEKEIVKMPCETHPSQQFSRANLILVREYLNSALGEGLNSKAMSFVIKAIKEIER